MLKFKSTILFFFAWMVSNGHCQEQKHLTTNTLPEKPNIVFIMMDDFDIFDMTKYKELFNQKYQTDHEINTPNLDAFFDQSLKFTNYHTNGANCSPTRGSLLTGLYPSDLGFYRAVSKNSERGIGTDKKLISEVLKTNGYVTANVGKWNVGHKGDSYPNPNFFKAFDRGFDYSFCTVGCYIDPSSIDKSVKQNMKSESWVGYGSSYSRLELEHHNQLPSETIFTTIGKPGGLNSQLDENQYITKINTDKAITFINEQNKAANSNPYFLNLWYWLPHGPVHVPMGIKQDGKLKSEYQGYKLRSNYPVSNDADAENIKHKVDLDSCLDNSGLPVKKHHLKCNSRLGEYAAMVTRLDAAIGRVLNEVKGHPNTLVIITSDNGGAGSEHVLRDSLTQNQGNDISKNLGIDPTLKFKGSKNELYERGIRVPLMIRWFGNNNQDLLSNQIIDQLVLSREFYPTLTSAAGLMLSNSHIYGENFLSLLQNNKAKDYYLNNQRKDWLTSENKPIFYENNAGNQPRLVAVDNQMNPACQPSNISQEEINYAIQNNDWKYIYTTSQWKSALFKDCIPEKSELFQTHADVNGMFETHNYAESFNHVVNYLKLLRLRWQHSIGRINTNNTIPFGLKDSPSTSVADKIDQTNINIADGHFTFATYFNPSLCDSDEKIVIAEKPGSWKLYFIKKRLSLEVNIATAGIQTRRSSVMVLNTDNEAVQCHSENHVGFTVLGGRTSGPLVKLYHDGKIVDTLVTTNYKNNKGSINQPDTKSPTRFHPINFKSPYVVISSSSLILADDTKSKFIKSITDPKMYVNPISSFEMALLAKSKAFESSFRSTNRFQSVAFNQNVEYSDAQFIFNDSTEETSKAILIATPSWGNQDTFGYSADIELSNPIGYQPMVIAQNQIKDSYWVLSTTYKKHDSSQLNLIIQAEQIDSNKSLACQPIKLSGSFIQNQSIPINHVGFKVKNNNVSLFINDLLVSKNKLPVNCKVNYGNQIIIGNHSLNRYKDVLKRFKGVIKNLQIEPKVRYSVESSGISVTGQVLSFKENNKGVKILLSKQEKQINKTLPFVFAITMNILNNDKFQKTTNIAEQLNSTGNGWSFTLSSDAASESKPFKLNLKLTNQVNACQQDIAIKNFTVAPYEEHQLGLAIIQSQISFYLDGKALQTSKIKPGCLPKDFDSDVFLGSKILSNQFKGYMYLPRIWHGEVSEDMFKWAAIYLDEFDQN